MKRVLYGFLFSMLLILGIGSVTVSAATKKNGCVTLNINDGDSYKKADVTGDGNKDTVEVVVTSSKETLKVNGKKIKAWATRKASGDIKIFTVGKKTYLEIMEDNYAKGVTECGIYAIRGGKLKSVLDYSSLIDKKILTRNKFVDDGYSLDMIDITKVSGNKLYLEVSLGTKALGQIKLTNLVMNYKSGKFVLSKTAGKAAVKAIYDENSFPQMNAPFTAGKQIALLAKAGSAAASGRYINVNEKFRLTKAAIIKKAVYIQVKKSNGTVGWMKLGKTSVVKTPGALIYG